MYDTVREVLLGNYEAVFKLVEEYDAFGDWPWPLIYPQLTRRFPEAKFILTLRESETAWLNSAIRHAYSAWESGNLEEHLEFIDSVIGADVVRSQDRFQHHYRTHAWAVRHFFENASQEQNRLLVMNWGNKSHDWDMLTEFLGKPAPSSDIPFPHENKSPPKLLANTDANLVKLRDVIGLSQKNAVPAEKLSTWSIAQLSQVPPSWDVPDLGAVDINFLDATGCLVIRDAIPGEVIADINGIIDSHVEQNSQLWAQQDLLPDVGCPRKFDFMSLAPIFFSIMEHPVLLNVAPYILGPGFRFDSAECGQMIPALNSFANLHGGPRPGKFPVTFYISGLPLERKVVRTSQLKFGVQLTEQNSATGGFCYVPGSHTSSDYGDVSLLAKNSAKLILDDAVTVPSLNPGDVFIFIDSLVHGCTDQKEGFRRTLYYSYCSSFAAMHPYEEEIVPLLSLAFTDVQQRLLRPPYDKSTDKVTRHGTWREPTV
jgi:hypothetical protein